MSDNTIGYGAEENYMKVEELFSVRGRSIIVTGASSGLGERFVRLLNDNGARVIAVARRADRLDVLQRRAPGIVTHVADLTDVDQRAGVVQVALQHFGRLDVLVNNAGASNPVSARDEDTEDFRRILELNTTAAFDLACDAAPPMIDQGAGSIINIASILGSVASSPIVGASYAASKGALCNLTRQLGCEWAPLGVRVNAIAPGWFPTEATESLGPGQPGHAFIVRNTPIGRFGTEGELDGALLYLASDASSFCTGSVLTVDGGWTAR